MPELNRDEKNIKKRQGKAQICSRYRRTVEAQADAAQPFRLPVVQQFQFIRAVRLHQAPVDLSAKVQCCFPVPGRSAARLRVAEQVEDRKRFVKAVRRKPRFSLPARNMPARTADAIILTEQMQI